MADKTAFTDDCGCSDPATKPELTRVRKKHHPNPSTTPLSKFLSLPPPLLQRIYFYVGTTQIPTNPQQPSSPAETLAALLYTRSVSPRILVVGSGNFTFPAAIARLRAQSKGIYGAFNVSSTTEPTLYATSYDSLAELHTKYGAADITTTLSTLSHNQAVVRHSIDATTLTLGLDNQRFDLVVFNFPKVGATTLEEFKIAGRVPRNRYLIASFLVAAVTHVLAPRGSIVVAQKTGHPYRCWTCTSATKWAAQVQQSRVQPSLGSGGAGGGGGGGGTTINTPALPLAAQATLTYHSCAPFVQDIFPGYRSANVSPEGSKKRRKKGFGTVALDGKPTAFMHVFTLQRARQQRNKLQNETTTTNELGGCTVCDCTYQSMDEKKQHLKGKKHKMNANNDQQWQKYLNYLVCSSSSSEGGQGSSSSSSSSK
jgi:hypothetical protein